MVILTLRSKLFLIFFVLLMGIFFAYHKADACGAHLKSSSGLTADECTEGPVIGKRVESASTGVFILWAGAPGGSSWMRTRLCIFSPSLSVNKCVFGNINSFSPLNISCGSNECTYSTLAIEGIGLEVTGNSTNNYVDLPLPPPPPSPPPPLSPPSAPVINQPATCYGDPYDPKVDLSWSNTGASSYTLKSCIWSFCTSQRDVPGCIGITGTSCTDNEASPADMYYWVRDNTTGLESNRVQVECLQCRLHSPATSNVGDTIIYSTHTRTPSFTFAGGGTPPSQGPSSNPFFSTVFNTSGSKQVTVISPRYTRALNCPAVNIIATPSPIPIPPSPPPPSGEPPLPPPVRDTKPPEISNVRIINITQTGATVLWNTDEASDSQVEYCQTASRCGILTSLDTGLTTRHLVNLSGLIPDKYYYIWAKSKDVSGNPRILGYYLFKTLAVNVTVPTPTPTPRPSPTPTPVPVNPPVISNVQITNITRNSATVTWETDRLADSKVFSCFLQILCYNILASDSVLQTSHSIILSKIKPNTNYYIQVSSADISGNQGYSGIIKFKTLPGLVISNIRVTDTTQSSITVAWETNYPADSRMVVCTSFFICFFSLPVVDSTVTSFHTMTRANLKSGVVYRYQVMSQESLGYRAESSLFSIKIPN